MKRLRYLSQKMALMVKAKVDTHIHIRIRIAMSQKTALSKKIAMSTSNQTMQLQRLLQLCSANLPVGGFAFSQGLEYAVEEQWLSNAEAAQDWILVNLQESIARTDLAIMQRQYQCLSTQEDGNQKAIDDFIYWDNYLIACRESAELRLADLAMGKALIRLLTQLDAIELSAYKSIVTKTEISFCSAFILATKVWNIEQDSALSGYCWTVIDNQVAAATKLIPLGQTQSQNMLFALSEQVEALLTLAYSLKDEELGASLPRLAMASAWHESQYSRLFRS